MSLLTRSPRPTRREPQPPCPGCAVARPPIDAGKRALWLCDDCGTTLPRA